MCKKEANDGQWATPAKMHRHYTQTLTYTSTDTGAARAATASVAHCKHSHNTDWITFWLRECSRKTDGHVHWNTTDRGRKRKMCPS